MAASPLAWRLDLQRSGSSWDSGVGSTKVGGRWNPVGYPVVYCSADPATAIVEVAVNKGFAVLDTIPHVLTRARILEVTDVHVVNLTPRAFASNAEADAISAMNPATRNCSRF
jgi:RES domain-containing protein